VSAVAIFSAEEELKMLNQQDELEAYHRLCETISKYFPNFSSIVKAKAADVDILRDLVLEDHSKPTPPEYVPNCHNYAGLGHLPVAAGSSTHGGYYTLAQLPKSYWLDYFPDLTAIRQFRMPGDVGLEQSAKGAVSAVLNFFDMWDQHEQVSCVELVVTPVCVMKVDDQRPVRDRLEKYRDPWILVLQPLLRITITTGAQLFAVRETKLSNLVTRWLSPRKPVEEINKAMYFQRIKHKDHPLYNYVLEEQYVSCFMLVELLSRKINLPPSLLSATTVERSIRIYSEQADSNSFVSHLLTTSNIQRETISMVVGFISHDMQTPLGDF
jgi:hypothetical protein